MGGGSWSGPGSWKAGLIVSQSTGAGEYRGEGPGGRVEAELTGLFPWARRGLDGGLEAWGAAGIGEGELTVIPKRADTEEDGVPASADLDLWMAAAGLRGTVLDGGSDGLTLTGKTDAMVVQTASGRGKGADGGNLAPARAVVSRLRAALEASRPFALGPGSEGRSSGSEAGARDPGTVLTPSLEVGLRHDGGDAENGFGVDLGAGLTLSVPAHGLEAELRGRGLLGHASKGFRERGVSGSLAWNQRPESDRGAKLTLTQTVGGASSGGAESLFTRATLGGLAADPGSGSGAGDRGDDLERRRLDARLGYGFAAFGGRFTSTPEMGFELAGSGRGYRLGWRLVEDAPAVLGFDVAVDGTRRVSVGGGGHEIGIGIGWRLANAGVSDRAFEARVEARRSESANDNAPPEQEIGLRLSVRF